jgi:serine/threonine protein kinase
VNDCLDDDALTRLVAGDLGDDERAELLSHLEKCDACRTLVADAVQFADETRTIAGRYRLHGEIGRGAMGMVYRAYDEVLDRVVAIKLLPAGDTDARARARLVRESRAMAKLHHPNVVAVHDAGWDGDQFWIAMEHIPGVTLRRWLASREPSLGEIVRVFTKAARGLAAAHAVGVVHRDFKPDNVLIDADGEPKVADFGLAHSGPATDDEAGIEGTTENVDDLTATGMVIGTPAYMPPEQVSGAAIDPRADVFAVCAVLWEALHGRRPFVETSMDARLHAIERGAFELGRRRIDAPLRRTLERGLAFDPRRRHPDMRALVAELEAFADRRARRRRTTIAFAIAIAVSSGVAATASTRPEPCAPPHDRLAIASSPAAMAEIHRAVLTSDTPMEADLRWSQLRSEIQGAIAGLDREVAIACESRTKGTLHAASARRRQECLRIERGSLAHRLELGARGDVEAVQGLSFRWPAETCRFTAEAWTDHGVDPERAAEYERALADAWALSELERPDPKAARADEAIRIAETLGAPALVARARVQRGQVAWGKEAEQMFAQAAAEAAGAREHSTAAKAWIHAGNVALEDDDAARYVALAREELELVEQPIVRRWLDGLTGHIDGRLLEYAGDIAGARKEYERALAVAQDLAPGRVPEFTGYLVWTMWSEGDLESAIAKQSELVEWHERTQGPNRYARARALWNLADLEREAGDLDDALVSIGRAREIDVSSDDTTVHGLHLLAEAGIAIQLGELDAAEQAIARANVQPGTPTYGYALAVRGLLALAREDRTTAAAHLRAAIDADLPEVAVGSDLADTTSALAETLRRDGKAAEGLALFDTWFDHMRSAHAPLPERGRMEATAGWLLVDLNRAREAVAHFDQALDVLVDPRERAWADVGRFVAARAAGEAADPHVLGRAQAELEREPMAHRYELAAIASLTGG